MSEPSSTDYAAEADLDGCTGVGPDGIPDGPDDDLPDLGVDDAPEEDA